MLPKKYTVYRLKSSKENFYVYVVKVKNFCVYYHYVYDTSKILISRNQKYYIDTAYSPRKESIFLFWLNYSEAKNITKVYTREDIIKEWWSVS